MAIEKLFIGPFNNQDEAERSKKDLESMFPNRKYTLCQNAEGGWGLARPMAWNPETGDW